MVSTVSTLSPLFLIRISLSSIREQRLSTAEPLANTLAGLSALSPYEAFFLSRSSFTRSASCVILSLEFIVVFVVIVFFTYHIYPGFCVAVEH
jgi:hypothetical protein